MHQIRQKISSVAYPLAGWFGLVMVFGLPWSHAFFYIGLVGLLFCLAVSTTHYKELLTAGREHIAVLALLLFAYIAAGLIYTHAPLELALFDVKKYRKLLLIPVFLMVYRDIKWAKRLVLAYSLGISVLMLPTLLDGTGLMRLLPLDLSLYRDGSYYDAPFSLVYWRNHIVHGFHVSLLFSICMLSSMRYRRSRWLLLAIAAVCIYDIVFLIHARMALIALLGAALLLAISLITQLRLRLALLITIMAAGLLAYEYSPRIQERFDSITQEVQAYVQDGNVDTSVGNRLHFWNMSLQIFRHSPIAGAGPGSFREALIQPDNPLHRTSYRHAHNEYLTLLSQHGLIGLILFLSLAAAIYRQAGRQDDLWLQRIVRIGLAIFCINALTDSSLHNESEGWTFVLLACLANMHARSPAKR